jgi:hypothetical protein
MNPLKNIGVFELSAIVSLFHSNLRFLVQFCVYYVLYRVHFVTMGSYVFYSKIYRSWMGAHNAIVEYEGKTSTTSSK